MRKIYRPDILYCKAGVLLLDLQNTLPQQGSAQLFLDFDEPHHPPIETAKKQRLMSALDNLTQRFGQDAVMLASQLHGQQAWKMRQAHRTPHYTTCL